MTTLLAIGDMHLGRPAPALPEDLRDRQSELGPEAAWIRAVDTALAYGVDAVLLAGDLIDRERDFFFAYGELRAGVERLSNAGIPVLAVAGNHDTETLPRLAEEIDSLELIGANGRWQLREFDGLGILGWSFPRPQVRSNPLNSLPALDLPATDTTIGLLHCDLDQTNSPYAPVRRRDLEAASVDAWLLGHIHRPDPLSSEHPIGYLGSISALRASETGARGPWLIEVSQRRLSFEHLPLAPLRFETLDVNCNELEDAAALNQTVLAAIRQRLDEINVDADDEGPLAIGWRITLSGHSPAAGQLAEAAAELAADGRSWQEAGLRCFIQRMESTVLPRLALHRLARQDDPSGLLARRLLALDEPGSEEFDRLVRLGRESLATPLAAPEFQALDRRLEEAEIVDWLRRSGRQALLMLLSQREAGQ